MPQIIARIPQRGLSRDGWDVNITAQLYALWFDRMPPADSEIAAAQEPQWPAKMSPNALIELDEIIVRQAGTLGWRIGVSQLVQWRLSEWENVPSGLKLLRRFHYAVERAARIFQRREKPPLDDPGLYRFKVETVKELRVLLREMRNAFQARLCDPPNDLEPKVEAYFLKALAGRRKSFPFLAQNREHWRAFLEEQPNVLRALLAEVRLRPASLFDSWLSWCKGVEDESLRQAVSHVGKPARKSVGHAKL